MVQYTVAVVLLQTKPISTAWNYMHIHVLFPCRCALRPGTEINTFLASLESLLLTQFTREEKVIFILCIH